MADDSGFDPEAELERELALLDSAGVLPGLEEQEGTDPHGSAREVDTLHAVHEQAAQGPLHWRLTRLL